MFNFRRKVKVHRSHVLDTTDLPPFWCLKLTPTFRKVWRARMLPRSSGLLPTEGSLYQVRFRVGGLMILTPDSSSGLSVSTDPGTASLDNQSEEMLVLPGMWELLRER